MLKKILFFISFSFYVFTTQDSAKLNDFEPVHILAALKFPINQVSAQDLFTQETFKNIEDTFAAQGINLDGYQLEHIKKSYLYLIFLTKLEKVQKDTNFKQYQTDFAPFLQNNNQSLPNIPTAELLNSKGWLQVTVDNQDIANSTMWQLFCKSMIADINAYLLIGLKLIHNCEKQEFNYIPHFETSYYNQDYVQIRNINAVVRIKIELEQQVQQRYLNICNDWKKFSNFTSKSIAQLETQIAVFQKTEFYQKTHNMHNLMGTQTKFNTNQKITHEDLLSAPSLESPLKEYVFGFFLLYELYGQLTSFMNEDNLDKVITVCASSKLSPNIFPYHQDDYVLISELLAGKNIIQDKPTNSVHPTIKTFKPEDLRDVKDWINPTRRPTDQYIQEQIKRKKTVQSQSFLSFFSDIGSDIVHAADDIKNGVEKACDAIKDFGESVGYGIAGFVLTIGGDTSEGNKLMKDSTQQFKAAIHDLESSINDFGSAIKEGIIAPVGELAGDVVGFITDDKKIGADIDTVISNCADALVNIAEAAIDTAATAVIYVYTLPEQIVTALIETMIAGIMAIWNQQAALDICHSILRSLVTTFMMVAQVAKNDFSVVMSALGTFMNSITTLFNDLIREMTVIITTGGIGLITNIADAAGANITTFDYANKAADTAYNTLNQHRAIINQVIGVAVMIGADIVTGGTTTAADVAIDAELEASLAETTEEAQTAISDAQNAVKDAQKAVDDAKTAEEKTAAQSKLNDAKAKLKSVKSENEKILKQVKSTREQAQDAARQAKEEREAPSKFLGKTRLRVKKFFRAYKNFLGKNKDIITGSFGRSSRFFKGFKDIPSSDISAAEKWSSFKTFLSEPTTAGSKLLENIESRASTLVSRVKSIPDNVNSLLEDGKNFITRDGLSTTQKSAKILSTKIDELTKAQEEFDQALKNYSASTKNAQEFAEQQENLLSATKKLRQAELDFEKAGQSFGKNFEKLGDQEKELTQDPLKVMKENAQQDVKTAEENLATEQEIGDAQSVQEAKTGLTKAKQQLKIIENSMSKVTKPDVPTDEPSVPLKKQLSNKLDDALEYVKSKARSVKNILKTNKTIAQQAEKDLAQEEEQLKTLNQTLQDQKAALEKDPDNPQLKKEVEDTQDEIIKKEKRVKRIREEARSAKTKADETAKEKAARYLKNAFSPIGMFMNIAFNFTSIIGGYNQDQKNLLQQKEQEQALQDLFKANTENKISVAHTDLATLDEIAEKQKASIGNQMLGLSLSQNYSYVNLETFQQTVQQTLAMIYALQLHQDSATGLMAGNIGTPWGLISNYLNLYPSEGFYVTTTGRKDFAYSQEVAQAPHLLTQTSKTKTKQWFNQRCIAVDSKNENNSIKNPADPLMVKINFRFLYTLDSEFYVGIYMGGSYHDYFAKTYLAALLGTTVDKLAQAYSELKTKLQQYAFNLNLIDINETYLAKMVVLYRESGTDKIKLGIYEQNLTNKEWLLQYELPESMQLNQNHTYNLQAQLDKKSLSVTISVEDNPKVSIHKTVSVTPISNQRMYGVISSGAAIEWNQVTPNVVVQIANNVRKPQALTLEVARNKENKLVAQEALNQIFGGKVLTLVSSHRARIFGQYIYASVQTDVSKIVPKSPADLLVFATNNNGVITNIGKAPNGFQDSTTNVLVSLITGHVFDQTWNCVSTIPSVWKNYYNSDYAPFLPTLQKTIEDQQKMVFSKLQYINFGPSFKLNAVSLAALESGNYLYTCDQTLTDASGKPIIDYLVLTSDVQTVQGNSMLGLPPTAANATAMISLVTGNVYKKNTKLVSKELPVATMTISLVTITAYLKQNLSSYASTILNQAEQYQSDLEQKQQAVTMNIEQAVSSGALASNASLFKSGKTFHFKFNFARSNLATRQKEAAASYKIQMNTTAKV